MEGRGSREALGAGPQLGTESRGNSWARGSQRNRLVHMTMREEEGSGRKEAISRWKRWEQVKCHGEDKDLAWA